MRNLNCSPNHRLGSRRSVPTRFGVSVKGCQHEKLWYFIQLMQGPGDVITGQWLGHEDGSTLKGGAGVLFQPLLASCSSAPTLLKQRGSVTSCGPQSSHGSYVGLERVRSLKVITVGPRAPQEKTRLHPEPGEPELDGEAGCYLSSVDISWLRVTEQAAAGPGAPRWPCDCLHYSPQPSGEPS